jgi:hypothetical protein
MRTPSTVLPLASGEQSLLKNFPFIQNLSKIRLVASRHIASRSLLDEGYISLIPLSCGS